MIEPAVMTHLVQFGVAGLMAWMWLTERRGAAVREKSIEEAHARLMEQRTQLGVLMDVVRENTRALVALEGAQRSLVRLVERLDGSERRAEVD